ncbi:hypothetical protein AAFC00_006840 [Neodothiora populina]|uniref:Protein-tyrosine-phosphatase n=1 Tax=Neodothiora populina TaxID=2781224 RepID=A0ABR3PBB0_9PEZI
MATVCARPSLITSRSSTPTDIQSINSSSRGVPVPIPNKHLPACPTGPQPKSHQLATPPESPRRSRSIIETSSLLSSPNDYPKLSDSLSIYALTGKELHDALDHIAAQPLPDPKEVFPWLHGLHPDNNIQLAFFAPKKRSSRRAPRCMRGITIVKTGGDLTHSRLKGAIAPNELLLATRTGEEVAQFLDVDPRDGFSVRNFQIQAAKMATVSDIVVYSDETTPKEEVKQLAIKIAKAQKAWRNKNRENGTEQPTFSTFVLREPFGRVADEHPDIVSLDAKGYTTGGVMDFFHSERFEMHQMSAATEIAPNLWLGPTPDAALNPPQDAVTNALPSEALKYDLFIEATDQAQVPDKGAYKVLNSLLSKRRVSDDAIPQLDFPASGSIMPPTWSQGEVDGLMQACDWIYRQTNGISDEPRDRKDSKVQIVPLDNDSSGDIHMSDGDLPTPGEGKKILLHCADGYTETSLLALAYYMYANCVPVHTAYRDLHMKHRRNFFSYPTDVILLSTIQPRILQSSPRGTGFVTSVAPPSPGWLSKMDGSLPSRIMDHMYLGNLGHANNPELLREMGIGQILSVGEAASWSDKEKQVWVEQGGGEEKVLYVDGVQDNGVDPLTGEFKRCLNFIEEGRKAGTATLVHCRVGVSRSATICIAEVMSKLGLSFPRAYCYVRARRLNVIIQPHLRFSYELLKWEELQCEERGEPVRRELEWATIAREIAALNRPYSRQ